MQFKLFWLALATALGVSALSGQEYRLEAGDEIEVRFFYNQELNDKMVIRPDGRIAMPMVGDLAVAGKTVAELTAELQAKYKETVRQPVITVQVRAFANRKVFVGGEVLKPGMITLTGTQTALGAILEAGGLLRAADRNRISVVRKGSGGAPEMLNVSIRSDRGKAPEAAGFALQPYDMVVVHRSGIAKANQAVDQYIRQMSPALLTGGFTYLFNLQNSNAAGGVIR
jgi:protein involved in polysaccharide export with SLBB domain